MADAQHVIFTFAAPRERMQPAFLPNGADFIAAPGQNFMRVGLVAHVPDQTVKRRVIDVVKRHGQFDRAEAGGKMPAGTADAVQQVAPEFVAQFRQAVFRQQTQLLGGIHQCQGRVFGNIKTHQRLLLFIYRAELCNSRALPVP